MEKFILSPEIEEMLMNFHKISGIRVGVYGMDWSIITEFPPMKREIREKRFCERCKDCSKDAYYAACKRCDAQAIEYACATGKPYAYKCHMGFLEAVIPVMAGGEAFCFLMIGQVRNRDELPAGKRMTATHMAGVIAQYNIMEEKYPIERAVEDYENMPSMDMDTFKAFVYFLELCAQKIYNDEYVRRSHTSVSRALMNFVNANIYIDVTVSDFAKSAGLSTSYVSHSIAKEMGTTFTKYLLMCRIEEAKRILRTTDMSIKKISVLLRYSDVSYFVRQFKKVTGMTCTEYREQRGGAPSKR